MSYRLDGEKGKTMNEKNYIHLIYEKEHCYVLAQFIDEDECIEEYKKHFNRETCDWVSINLTYVIKEIEAEKQRMYEEYPH